MTMVTITVRCQAPRNAEGEHEFGSFMELLGWLENIHGAKSSKGSILVSLAEYGSYVVAKYGFALDIKSGPTLGYAAKELAREVGVIERRGFGSDKYVKDNGTIQAYAQELDARLGK